MQGPGRWSLLFFKFYGDTMRYLEIKNKIQQHYDSLPKKHRKLADFIIDHLDQVPFLSVKDISVRTGGSVASVVRFAQRSGFSGYSEMRKEIATALKNQLQAKEIFPLFKQKTQNDDILTAVANQEIKNINDTLHMVERLTYNKLIDDILKAKRIYTAGLGISNLLAQMLAYQLNQVGVDAFALKHDYVTFLEQLLFVKPANMVIAFSFPPYSKETIDAAEFAQKNNVKVVSITNRNASPITFFSDYNLVVPSKNMLFTNSFSAISVLINAISTGCAMNDKERAEKMLESFNEIMKIQEQVIL
jgi:DNA-binding MurR/RpiR family transcriptional regulator